MTNARKDYLDKVSTEIIKNQDVIGIEDLQVSNMLKNHKLAKGQLVLLDKCVQYQVKFIHQLFGIAS